MLFTFKKLLNHYASATLIDVLHSPFVFELYNSCFKRRSNIKTPYAQSGHVEEIIAKLCIRFPQHAVITVPNQAQPGQPFLLIPETNIPLTELDVLLSQAHNDSFLVIKHPHASEQQFEYWEQLKQRAAVTAVIDLFFVGLVFVRTEQRKQVFKLRLF